MTILLAELAVTAQDPETRRDELRRLQRDATIVLADHGGEPVRTSDPRVLGILGIPAAREDDAFRAVQAACALRSAGHAAGDQGPVERPVTQLLRQTAPD